MYLVAATLLRVSAEGFGTALVLLVHARTGQAASAGFLVSAVLLPYVVSGPVLGNALDRARRTRSVTILFAVGYLVAMTLLLTVAGRAPLIVAAMAAIAVGCCEPITVALTSLLPRLVPAARLTRAYGLESASYNLAGIAGPGLAAGLTATVGATAGAFSLVGVALLGTLALLPLRIPPHAEFLPAGPPVRPGLGVVTGGLALLFGNPVLRALTLGTALAFLGMGGISVVAVLLATHLAAGAAAGGQLLTAFAVGALIGSLGAARWLSARHMERVVTAGMAAFGLFLAIAAVSPGLPWAVASFALAGMCDGPVLTATMMLRQREAPAERLGQVNTTGGSLKLGTAAVGAALTATFATHTGAPALLLAMGSLQLLGALTFSLTRGVSRTVR